MIPPAISLPRRSRAPRGLRVRRRPGRPRRRRTRWRSIATPLNSQPIPDAEARDARLRPVHRACRGRARVVAGAGRRPLGAHSQGLCAARSRRPLRRQVGGVVLDAARLCRRGWSIAAAATSITSCSRSSERGMPLEVALLPMVESAFNPVAMSTQPRVRHLAVHARDRQGLRPQAELLVRLPARRDRGDRRRAQLSAAAARAIQRLAAGSRRVQLGRGQRRAGDREEPAGRPADRLREPRRCPTRRAITCPSCRR